MNNHLQFDTLHVENRARICFHEGVRGGNNGGGAVVGWPPLSAAKERVLLQNVSVALSIQFESGCNNEYSTITNKFHRNL